MNRIAVRTATTLLLLFAIIGGTAVAQPPGPSSDRTIDVLVPSVLSIRSDVTEIAFDLSTVDFPPPEFPHRYRATSLPDGLFFVDVLASASGPWEILLEIDDLVDPTTGATIPAERVQFRVDGGPWIRGGSGPKIVLSGTEQTFGWRPVEIAMALEVRGDEPAGAYEVTMSMTGLFGE